MIFLSILFKKYIVTFEKKLVNIVFKSKVFMHGKLYIDATILITKFKSKSTSDRVIPEQITCEENGFDYNKCLLLSCKIIK
jgi:hypothetical protein